MAGPLYGTRVIEPRDLQRIISTTPVGQPVKLSLLREGKETEVTVTSGGTEAIFDAVAAVVHPGDEVIMVASGFPTTVNPILQNGLVPVFVDVEVPTYNIDANYLEAALSEKTRAIMVAHTLGNPFNLNAVTEFCKQHNLWLVEDCCDAVGAAYNGQPVGRFGDVATVSFYPAHHITMGEG